MTEPAKQRATAKTCGLVGRVVRLPSGPWRVLGERRYLGQARRYALKRHVQYTQWYGHNLVVESVDAEAARLADDLPV